MIKMYDRVRYREKFKRFRILFFILSLLIVTAFLGEVFWLGDDGYSVARSEITFSSFFCELFIRETLILLALFLFGVTIYAPLFGAVCIVARGFFSAFCLSVLYSGIGSGKEVFIFANTLIYLLLSAWILLGYTSFCTATALELFSPPKRTGGAGESRMFGGALFYSAYFRNTVNFRFLGGYFLLFVGVILFQILLSLVYAALQSLI